MFRKSFTALAALLTLALLSATALAADPAPKPAEETPATSVERTTLGDISALAALKEKMEQGESDE